MTANINTMTEADFVHLLTTGDWTEPTVELGREELSDHLVTPGHTGYRRGVHFNQECRGVHLTIVGALIWEEDAAGRIYDAVVVHGLDYYAESRDLNLDAVMVNYEILDALDLDGLCTISYTRTAELVARHWKTRPGDIADALNLHLPTNDD